MPKRGFGSPENEGFDSNLDHDLERWAENTGLEEEDITPEGAKKKRNDIEAAEAKTSPYDETHTPTPVEVEDSIISTDIAERLAGYPDISSINPADYPKDKLLLEFAKTREEIRNAEIPKPGIFGTDKEYNQILVILAKLAGLGNLVGREMRLSGLDPIDFFINRLRGAVEVYSERHKEEEYYYKFLLAQELLNKLLRYKIEHE